MKIKSSNRYKSIKSPEPIYRNGRIYNAQHKNFKVDIPFYIGQCTKHGGPVLELACGTGRVTIPIAKEGIDITGIDISPGMLTVAKENAEEMAIKIVFIRADIRKFNLRKKFSVIIFPFNAIAHLYDIKDITACLNCVKKHLKPNGKFIFDFFNPRLDILLRDRSKRYPTSKFTDPDSGKKIIITENNEYDRKTQINHIKWYYNIGGRKFVEALNMRVYFPRELDSILLYNGFKINHKYGDFDCSKFSSASPKQIYVCSVDT